MSSVTTLFNSTIGKKLVMALTGIFFTFFLVAHVSGNLLLFKGDGGVAYNEYSKFMSTNPFIQTVSKINFAIIILHIVFAIMLTMKNKSARNVKYAVSPGNATSTWASRNMGMLGFLLLVFVVLHIKTFYWKMKFGEMPVREIEGVQVKDMYLVVKEAFSQTWYSLFYVVAMVGLMFHLRHGFQSSFQSLGARHPKYTPLIKGLGVLLSVIVPVLFAAMPVYFLFVV